MYICTKKHKRTRTYSPTQDIALLLTGKVQDYSIGNITLIEKEWLQL